MKTLKIGGKLETSAIALGCMRIASLEPKVLGALLKTALENGVNFFDHADIYGGGESETVFAKALKTENIARDKVYIQTKGGIKKGQFDFSKQHIITALDNSLKRLDTDYTDVYLLHRPDTLFEPEEVAEAFTTLHTAGKVKYFGVSNQNPGQIKLLQKYLGDHKIIANQLQFSPAHTGIIDAGFNVNMTNPPSVDHDGGILEFCRLKNITIQAWSPFLYGFFEGVFLDNPKFPELNKAISEIAKEHNITAEAVVIAWILRHPAKIQPIPGTTNAERLKGITGAYSVTLSREEWYKIYCAAGNVLP
ncbi:MAG: aldo/keto reductase [Defluviitaleaceae bacterium]|nr:aldo/keto reductase [Defluviitaleaceae bacterium]